MTETNLHSQQLAFDPEELLARVENDQELLYELLSLFKDEYARLQQSLKEAALAGDMKGIQVIAHTLKGMLGNIAATRGAARAAALEQLGKNGEKAGLQDALGQFTAEMDIVLPSVDAYLGANEG